MKCRHCGCENDDRSKVCAECGKPLGEAAGEPADPSLTQPVMPVRQSIGDRLQGKGKTLGIAISLGCALVLGAIGYGAWRLGAFQGPVKVDSEQAGDTDADAETETQAEASTDEASTYTRPTEPWSKDEGTSDQGGTSSGGAPSGGSQGSYQNSNGANNGNSHSDAEQPTQDEPPAEEPAPKKEEEAPKEAEPEPTDDGMPMHESLSEYSWSEMAALADRIGSCASEQEAKDIARRHHLIDESGSLSDASLDVTLDDGTTMHMRLAGIWHDRADTPSGRAGLTFISKNIVGRHVYGDTETQEGGWGSSSLRSWMCSELLGAFPDELERSIRPAYKLTNRSMSEVSPDMVTETLDVLWSPSIIELCGPIAWEYHTEPDNADLYNSVFNEEGTQYQAFAQMSIDDYGPNGVFSLGDEWWLRSCSPRSGRGRFVSTDGDPSYISMANEEKCVVVGFCL